MENHKRVILVLGVPRSGTSALTKGLETMGICLGNSFIPANSYNPKGDYEDVDIQEFNTTLLYALEGRRRLVLALTEEEVTLLCQQNFLTTASELLLKKTSSSNVFGIKDPRFSLFLPFWKKVFTACGLQASFVISLRDPWSVAASTTNRHKLFRTEHLEKLFWNWISYLISCLEQTQGYNRILVDYNELLKHPEYQMQRIAEAFELTLQPKALQTYCHDFIDTMLCHFQEEKKYFSTNNSYQQCAMEIYETLLPIAKGQTTFHAAHIPLKKWKQQFSKVTSLLVLAEKNDFTMEELQRTILDRQHTLFEFNKIKNKNTRSIANLCQTLHQRNIQLGFLSQTFHADRDEEAAKADGIKQTSTLAPDCSAHIDSLAPARLALLAASRQSAPGSPEHWCYPSQNMSPTQHP
ncbi:MAG: sulfotransferase family protein [Chthoniobacterales bacterium]